MARAARRETMIAEIRITPVGHSEDFPRLVARAVEVVAESRLQYHVHAMGTTVEGSLEEILDTFRRLHEAARKHCDRILMELAIDDRSGAEGELVRSLERVKRLEIGVSLERLVVPAR
jgi:uncharacterized protein (TIGR00106 family)